MLTVGVRLGKGGLAPPVQHGDVAATCRLSVGRVRPKLRAAAEKLKARPVLGRCA